MTRDTYFVTDRGTRHETHWRRCGVCGTTQARTRSRRYGRCMFRALHERAAEAAR